jgi:hypothetical protein
MRIAQHSTLVTPFALGALVTLGAAMPCSTARADAATETVAFAFEADDSSVGVADEAVAYVTAGAEAAGPVPIVVFLSGPGEPVATHFRAGPLGSDLRGVADALVASGAVRPFVLAAPSSPRMPGEPVPAWTEFDLDAFVDSTELAVGHGLGIDREQVIVVRDSGVGCGVTEGPLVMRSPPMLLAGGRSSVVWTCPASNHLPETAGTLAAVTLGVAPVAAGVAPTPARSEYSGFPFFVDPRPSVGAHDQVLERTMRGALVKLLPMSGSPAGP